MYPISGVKPRKTFFRGLMLYPSSGMYFSFLHNWLITKTITHFLTELKILPHRQRICTERKSSCYFFTPVLNFAETKRRTAEPLTNQNDVGVSMTSHKHFPVFLETLFLLRRERKGTKLYSLCEFYICLALGVHRKNSPANNLHFRTVCRRVGRVYWNGLHFFKCLSSSSSRAPGELDGHQGDPPGGHGVPAQIPGGHHGGAAQRRGAVCGRRQENSGHGKEGTTGRPSYSEIFSASSQTVFRLFSCCPSGVKASAWMPTLSLVRWVGGPGVGWHSEDAISLDTVAEFIAWPALSPWKSLNVIGPASALDNEVSGSRTVRHQGGSRSCDQA